MILRNGLNGLGAWNTNQAMFQATGVINVDGNVGIPDVVGDIPDMAVFDPTVSGGFSITQHRFEEIIEEIMPGWYAGYAAVTAARAAGVPEVELAATLKAMDAALYGGPNVIGEKQRSLATGLPLCPTGSLVDGGFNCYNSLSRDAAALTTNDPRDPWGLIMPGTLVMYGVPFTPKDYKDGRITRVFKPDALQRKLFEHAVIRASMIHLFGHPNAAMNPITRMLVGDGHIRDSMRLFLMKQGAGIVSNDQLEALGRTASVDEMVEMVPDIKLFLVNFQRNPVQPDRWRTAPGGWMEWIRNGGYPLSDAVAHAKVSISEGELNPMMCESILCQCPSANGWPSCQTTTLSKAAGTDTSGGWRPYVAIYQDMANPLFEFALVYQEPSTIEKIGEFLGSWMEKLGKWYCGFIGSDAGKKQVAQVQADNCINAQGQPCVRGTPGCTCTAPTNASTTSASNANLYVQAARSVHGGACAAWMDQETPPPPLPDPLPLFPPPPPEPKGFKLTPTMIALGVAGLGAAVLLTRKKRV